jgi:hypothetical protein
MKKSFGINLVCIELTTVLRDTHQVNDSDERRPEAETQKSATCLRYESLLESRFGGKKRTKTTMEMRNQKQKLHGEANGKEGRENK